MGQIFLTDFEKFKYYYNHEYWTKEQVRKMVELGKITPEEYEQIVGESYVTPTT